MTTKKIVYVGIDVDDKAFHGAGLSLETGEMVQFKCKPDFGVLIYIPNEEDEEIRDLLRSRGFLVKQRKMLKTHILSACKRYGIYFLKETGHKTNWTDTHIRWLKKRAKELGDIRRFPHPRQLTAYCGLDITEYRSGGKQNKKGITKTGNKHVRTILTESCQLALNPPILSKRLKKLREGQPQEVIDIADRCMSRLHKKSTRRLYAGKHKNKIKTAAAREMLGFIWEVMNLTIAKAQ